MKLFDDSIIAEQIDTELEATTEGVAKYRRLARQAIERGDGAALKPAERLMVGWVRAYVPVLRKLQDDVLNGVVHEGAVFWGPALMTVSAERQAVIAMHEVIGQCMAYPAGVDQPRVMHAIGRGVNAEWILPQLRADDDAWDALAHTDTSRITPANAMRVARKHISEADWGVRVQTHLGGALLKSLYDVAYVPSLIESEGEVPAFIRTHKHIAPKRAVWAVTLSAAAVAAIDDGHSYRQYLRPRYQAMLMPPRPWTGPREGGYLKLVMDIVKRPNPGHRRTLKRADLSRVYPGLNALQATAWRINRRILDVIEELWAGGGNVAGLPRSQPHPLPPKPADIATNKTARDRWKGQAHQVYRRNSRELGERVNFAQRLDAARRGAEREALWFPLQMDLRGRVYAVPIHLNHQGDDVCRGLLEFAEAKPLTDRGRWWLKVHLANCCDIKGSFAVRTGWADASLPTFAGWAADPLANTGWMEVDKPFQALAAAMALTDGGPCRTPVQLDGTANALQHYAALGRNRSDAALVNLTAADEPDDPYTRIAAWVSDRIDRLALTCDRHARTLQGNITRSLVKRPCMTTLYGVTAVGARRQVEEGLGRLFSDRRARFEASKKVAALALEGMAAVCPTARAIMDWLREVGDRISRPGNTIRWVTPLGLPIDQPYRKVGYLRIRTMLQTVQMSQMKESGPSAYGKQTRAFLPNFIHSMDASHMLIAAQWAADKGLTLAGVHDGYWTHAADADALGEIIRDSFYGLHDSWGLHNLIMQLRATYPAIDLPDPPPQGDWDLAEVLDSPYAFH